MATIHEEVIYTAINRAYALLDINTQNNIDKEHEFTKQTILADESLTKDEKSKAIKRLNEDFDYFKIRDNEGKKRICENCLYECLATLYCEHCVRNYLKSKFSNWTSGNENVDNLIQKCGCSEIYTADWINGYYYKWDPKEKQLIRFGEHKSISHLTISSKYGQIVQCYGLTKDPSDGNYILVICKLSMNLRTYLQQNHNKLTWKKRIEIAYDIIFSLYMIHDEKAIHRDLHSGNILFNQIGQGFGISDLGFCGPADKPLNSVYGNLPYIAPEVITEKKTTFSSDIYSIGMLMWEISSGEPPYFACFDHDYDLAMKIINGMRPKIVPGTPLKYRKLMEQCWDADPTKRPGIRALNNKFNIMNRLCHKNENEINIHLNTEFSTNSGSINSLVRYFNSKIYNFKDLPEPRNATKGKDIKYC
ncbi:kinase-like domain-containing protein [Glomus cerebriforme]|uniref:Kinase-like domain-containing protein n=1 Tax=Glomus cerebriforme TaxID=658196 RepID=A0A397TI94_9GLOM|nr:kinase-like domain-containing protein [Glomus cerebriforme]